MVFPALFGGAGLPRAAPAAPTPRPTRPPGPRQPAQQNSLQKQAQDAIDKARDLARQSAKQMADQGGMQLLVVEGARIVCSETNPAKKLNTLKVPAARSVVEGKKLAQVQDVQRGTHIAPWMCECKKRPKPGGGYLPCDYKPQGMWKPGIQTETNDARNPQQRSKAYQDGYKTGQQRGLEGLRNMQRNGGVESALRNAAARSSQSFQDLATMSIIESTANPLASTGTYHGLMQMGSAAARDVGMSLGSMLGGSQGAMNNNALGGARYMDHNARILGNLKAAGSLPGNVGLNGANLYMAHQQGAGGFSQMMRTIGRNPNAPLTANQANQGVANARTQGQFKDYFEGKWDGVKDQVEKKYGRDEGSSGKKQEQAVPQCATHKCVLGGTISIVDSGQRTKKGRLGGASLKP